MGCPTSRSPCPAPPAASPAAPGRRWWSTTRPCGPPWRQASPICTTATPREPSPAATTTCPWGPGTNLVEARASGLFRPAAVVLSDDQPLAAAPRTLVATRKDAVHRTLDPRAGGGVVVLRENTNRGWVAQQAAGRWTRWSSTDGSRAGECRRPHVRCAWRTGPNASTGRVSGLACCCLLVLLTGVAMRRLPLWRDTPGPGLHGRELPAPVRVAAGLLAGGLLAGWIGLAVASVTVVLGSLIQRRAPEAGPWLLAAVVLPSAVAYAFRPWGELGMGREPGLAALPGGGGAWSRSSPGPQTGPLPAAAVLQAQRWPLDEPVEHLGGDQAPATVSTQICGPCARNSRGRSSSRTRLRTSRWMQNML